MYTGRRDRAARSVFAALIIAAHVLFAYFLTVPLHPDTKRAPSGGEAVLVLIPGESREAEAQPEPASVEPTLAEPRVVWVPTTPNFAIQDLPDDSREVANARLGSGRSDVPGALDPDAGIAVLKRVLPQYPIESVRANEEGSAVLQVLVDEAGRASEVRVARSSGYGRLDDSAVRAVRLWKFAPSTKGALAVPTWGEMELRFNLYQFTVSRIVDAPIDLVPLGQILNAANQAPVPGGEVALRLLIDEVRSANADAFDAPWLREELKRMKAALASWGEASRIRYKGAAAGNRWRAYEIRPEFSPSSGRQTVSLRWDVYEVAHDHGESEWRIALDQNGTIWSAHADSVRPGAVVLQVSR